MEFVLEENEILTLEDLIPTHHLVEDVLNFCSHDGANDYVLKKNTQNSWNTLNVTETSTVDLQYSCNSFEQKVYWPIQDSCRQKHIENPELASYPNDILEEIRPLMDIFDTSKVGEYDSSSDDDKLIIDESGQDVDMDDVRDLFKPSHVNSAVGYQGEEKSLFGSLKSRTFEPNNVPIHEKLFRPKLTVEPELSFPNKEKRSKKRLDNLKCNISCNYYNRNLNNEITFPVTKNSDISSIKSSIENVVASTYSTTTRSISDVTFKSPTAKKHKKSKKEINRPSCQNFTQVADTRTAKVATKPIDTPPIYDVPTEKVCLSAQETSLHVSNQSNKNVGTSEGFYVIASTNGINRPMDKNSNCPRPSSILGRDTKTEETSHKQCDNEGAKNSYSQVGNAIFPQNCHQYISNSWNPVKLPTSKFPSWLNYDHQTLGKLCCNICQITLMPMYITDNEMFKIINSHFCSSAHITKSLCNGPELFAMVYKFLKRSVDDGSSVYDILKRLSAIVGDKFCVSPPSLKSVFKTFTLANESVFKKILPTFKFSILADACNGYLIIRFINSKGEVREIFIPSYMKNNTTPIQDFLKYFLHTDALDTHVLHVTTIKSCASCIEKAEQRGPWPLQLPLRNPDLSDALRYLLFSTPLSKAYYKTLLYLSSLYKRYPAFFQNLKGAHGLSANYPSLFSLEVFNVVFFNAKLLRAICGNISEHNKDPYSLSLAKHSFEFGKVIGYALYFLREVDLFWQRNPENSGFFSNVIQDYLNFRTFIANESLLPDERILLDVLNSYMTDSFKDFNYNRHLTFEAISFLWDLNKLMFFHKSMVNVSTLRMIYDILKPFIKYEFETLVQNLISFSKFLRKIGYQGKCINDVLQLFISDQLLVFSFGTVYDLYVAAALFPVMRGIDNLSFYRLNICKYILSSKFSAELVPDILNMWLQGPSNDAEIESARISLICTNLMNLDS